MKIFQSQYPTRPPRALFSNVSGVKMYPEHMSERPTGVQGEGELGGKIINVYFICLLTDTGMCQQPGEQKKKCPPPLESENCPKNRGRDRLGWFGVKWTFSTGSSLSPRRRSEVRGGTLGCHHTWVGT